MHKKTSSIFNNCLVLKEFVNTCYACSIKGADDSMWSGILEGRLHHTLLSCMLARFGA